MLVAPVGEINVSRRPLLIWLVQPDAVSYQIVIRRDGKVVRRIPVGIEACYNGFCSLDWSLRPDLSPLKANATFEWRVRINTAQKPRASTWAMFAVGSDDFADAVIPEVPSATETPTPSGDYSARQPYSELTTVVSVGNTTDLINAVVAIATSPGKHVILIRPGTYTFTQRYAETYSAFPEIGSGVDLTLRGVKADGNTPASLYEVILQRSPRANKSFDFFNIKSGATLTLYDLTLRYGGIGKPGPTTTPAPTFTGVPDMGRQHGGAFMNGGTLRLFRVILMDNDVTGGGGAIYNYSVGRVELANVRFISNQAGNKSSAGQGGAIYNMGIVRVINPDPTRYCVLFDRNRATGPEGGAVYSAATGSLWLDRSVFFRNAVSTPGYGGIYVSAGSSTPATTPTATPIGIVTPIAYARNSWWNPAEVKATNAKQRVSGIVNVAPVVVGSTQTATPPAINCIPPTPITPTPTPIFIPSLTPSFTPTLTPSPTPSPTEEMTTNLDLTILVQNRDVLPGGITSISVVIANHTSVPVTVSDVQLEHAVSESLVYIASSPYASDVTVCVKDFETTW